MKTNFELFLSRTVRFASKFHIDRIKKNSLNFRTKSFSSKQKHTRNIPNLVKFKIGGNETIFTKISHLWNAYLVKTQSIKVLGKLY